MGIVREPIEREIYCFATFVKKAFLTKAAGSGAGIFTCRPLEEYVMEKIEHVCKQQPWRYKHTCESRLGSQNRWFCGKKYVSVGTSRSRTPAKLQYELVQVYYSTVMSTRRLLQHAGPTGYPR